MPSLVRDFYLTNVLHESGRSIPDWPKLLHLYSRMRPGKTVFEWMQDHDVRSPGIDVRKFASFGVLKVRIFYLHKSVKRGRD
jgi:hypothetical protein